MPYEVRSVSHSGLTVSDLDEALRFWTEALGFESLGSGEFGGTFVEGSIGVPGVRLSRLRFLMAHLPPHK